MELMCEDCRAILQISDARVPSNSTFRLSCPRCKKKIVVSAKTPESEGGRDKVAVGTAAGSSEVAPPACNSLKEEFAEEMGSLPLGEFTALLCLDRDDAREMLQAVLQGMGYRVDTPVAVDQALQRLRFNQYHVIVLTEEFGGTSSNPVAAYLAWLNMNIRRGMYVVLVGERFKSADHLQAFIESVNLVLHPDDLPRIETFLKRGLKDHERFYKVFVDCMIEAGKKL